MIRRHFLLVAPLALAGCRNSTVPTVLPGPDPELLRREQTERNELLSVLERHRVAPDVELTTPPPPVRVGEKVPAVKGLIKASTRLHPRYSELPGSEHSRLGGLFIWPLTEDWPKSSLGVNLVPILQLRKEDCHPQQFFAPRTNLMQLFWNPLSRDLESLEPAVIWRHTGEVDQPRRELPQVVGYPSRIPVACRLFPELVLEFPPLALLPDRILGELSQLPNYDQSLGSCPGTKAGGYPFGLTKETVTACEKCKRPMEFLVAIAGQEWTAHTKARWKPTDDAQQPETEDSDRAANKACGLHFDDDPARNRVNLFVCNRCEGWPVRVIRG